MEVLNLFMVSLNKSFCKPKLNKTLLVLTVKIMNTNTAPSVNAETTLLILYRCISKYVQSGFLNED